MTCEQVRSLLSPYVDRELELTKSLEMESHLRGCKGCSTALQGQEALRTALSAAPLSFTPPPGLEERVRKAVRREGTPRARFALSAWWWAAVPATAALAIALSWGVINQRTRTTAQDLVLAELVSSHVRSLMVEHLVDVVSSDQHTVKPWFNGKVDFAPPVFDLTSSGFPLVGGRLDYIGEQPVAVVVYKHRLHVINVFIWPAAKDPAQSGRELNFQGYHLLKWTQSGLTFWAVSDLSQADLNALAGLFVHAG